MKLNKSTSALTVIACSLLNLTFAAPAAADGKRDSVCEKTAKTMYSACRLDTWDDYNVAEANCMNLSDRSDRRACSRAALAERREGLASCRDQLDAREETCEVLGEDRYDPDPLLDPDIVFVEPDDVDPQQANPFVSVVSGHTHVLREGDETIVVHVTADTKEINGVACRVVVDAVVEQETDETGTEVEYAPVEVTDDWFAQDVDGNVYYCGELARNFEDGELVDLDGSFKAGVDRAKSGLLIAAQPQVGLAHRQEFALGEAEDVIQYADLAAHPTDDNPRFPCAAAGGCLQTLEFTPLEPDTAEYKYYLPGIGFVMAEKLEDGLATGERAELVCTGDSLDVLHDAACEIADPEALLASLCRLSPDAFCTDQDEL
ncbi:MAG: hypothetical protein H6955_01510 [Chromatiaceae bacterium]|nr:hypothetical protein [Chromatiaceae bacterium]